MERHITVFGATGKIGSELIRLLSQTEARLTAVSRHPGPTKEWIRADMSDPATLPDTLRGAHAVFLLSGHSPHFVTGQTNVIRAAAGMGVRHIVKLSSGAADKNSPLLIPRVHGEVEAVLKASGVRWTMLQPNGIMQNWLGPMAKTVRETRKIYDAAGDGSRAYVDLRDIAGVACACLTQPEAHYDQSYFLTGDQAVNYPEIAAIFSRVIGENIAYIPISLDSARANMERGGLPRSLADTFVEYARAQRDGQTGTVTDHVRRILGRPARTVEAFARDYIAAFK